MKELMRETIVRVFVFMIAVIIQTLAADAQPTIRIRSTYAENYASTELQKYLTEAGCKIVFGGRNTGHTINVGIAGTEIHKYKRLIDSLDKDGYFILGDGNEVVLYGKGEKGTLYAVYGFLELMGFRLYTPTAMKVPDLRKTPLPKCHVVSNPAFEYREVAYYYPNNSQLYADWHHLHTEKDRMKRWGMFVHTFKDLLPATKYYNEHPEWYSLNNGQRSRDGQLCLSNPEVLEVVCKRLRDTMDRMPKKQIWAVSPNDNYNACTCPQCRHRDSIYGGPSGTLIDFVNKVARRFPDKTIATLAYQYTRQAPTNSTIKPDSNVMVMLCPIESGRELPITYTDKEFVGDLENWSKLTKKLFVWDYVVQFRNYWTPFPNLHVIQPNLQLFHSNGARLMFEQASGSNNITSWMDIRNYLIAKLLWDPYTEIDSIMNDFYQGYYSTAGKYVKQIIDTMTAELVKSNQRLDIYGYPIDGAKSYLTIDKMKVYDSLLQKAMLSTNDSAILNRLDFFGLPIQYAKVDLAAAWNLVGYTDADEYIDAVSKLRANLDELIERLNKYGVGQMMEMGISPEEYATTIAHYIGKLGYNNKAYLRNVELKHPPTPPYTAGQDKNFGQALTCGEGGILDYRHAWLGFWGDTVDATIDLGMINDVNEVSIDFYFFPLSWIFLPEKISFQVSIDGVHWQSIGEKSPTNPEILAKPEIYTFDATCKVLARYVRIVAIPLNKIPIWHRAAGETPWIFTDQIVIK